MRFVQLVRLAKILMGAGKARKTTLPCPRYAWGVMNGDSTEREATRHLRARQGGGRGLCEALATVAGGALVGAVALLTMSSSPSFRLRNLLQVLGSPHVSTSESTSSHGPGGTRAVSSEPSSRHVARCMAWAQENGRLQSVRQFAASLDGRQVSAELFEQFRRVPAFGRDLTERIDPFLDNDSSGELTLIDAGGEATVFFDPEPQRVIKLFAPPNEGRFGWVLERQANGKWGIRGGSLPEAMFRFAWFEACFVSGLELDTVGLEADFLTLSQPFFVGRRPCEDELAEWMKLNGWEPWGPQTDQATVAQHTWRRDGYIATDVLPRNAIVTEADERLRAIDFIVTQVPS